MTHIDCEDCKTMRSFIARISVLVSYPMADKARLLLESIDARINKEQAT